MKRAFSHTRGFADFVNITVERTPKELVRKVPLLAVDTIEVKDVNAGRTSARRALAAAGVTEQAIDSGIMQLINLPDSMRGAMLVSAETGARLDTAGTRGIRVSRMDIADQVTFARMLALHGLEANIHAREAMVLAAKVAAAGEVLAELCWSDDPEYIAGYVASRQGYIRITKLKAYGSGLGGRVFFVKSGSDIRTLTDYLEKQPVLATVLSEE
ncbi:MAG: 6-carboxyhexanoate/CoA ligase [Firmicutes bacterium]|nr:6-carboxyhexanoate/CoA ligase [Bacillota bacterium]